MSIMARDFKHISASLWMGGVLTFIYAWVIIIPYMRNGEDISMKKLIVLMLAVLMVMSTAALGEGMGVQIISGENLLTEEVSLDDLQLNADVEVDGWGNFTALAYKVYDNLHQYKQGKTSVENNWNRFSSGVEAEYVLLQANILNTTNDSHDYLAECEVKVIFNDSTEFAGWFYQYNWDNGTKDKDWNELNGIQNKEFVIDKADQFPIDPWYVGHYAFGCTLPNAVIESKAPLAMIITIDGNEITYNIRK